MEERTGLYSLLAFMDDPKAPEPPSTEMDFFRSQAGSIYQKPFWQKRKLAFLLDRLYDLRLRFNPFRKTLATQPRAGHRGKVLVLGVDVPSRSKDLQAVFQALAKSRHEVVCEAAPLLQGLGKFQNINRALAHHDLSEFEWLVVTDDDIALPPRFLDTFLDLAEREQLKICMPAHCFNSHLGFLVTQRKWNSLVRVTRFVECGPLTAFHRDIFSACLPFPELRWAWGSDVLWSQIAWDKGMRIGVVDACPLRHLRPVAGSYDGDEARLEAEAFLREAGVHRSRTEFLETVSVVKSLS